MQNKQKLKEEKEKRKKLRIEKQTFQILASEKYTTILQTLKRKFTNNPNTSADNLMSLLENKYFLINCYETLKSNRGALTKGTDTDTADAMAEDRIEKLVKKIKDRTFKFRPSRRIQVPKPDKTTTRPLTIPNFDDRIIQEATRVILNAIYEPIFQKIQVNFGFRPNLSTTDAMEHLTKNTSNATTAIEGYIKGAYDNVEKNTMINILSMRIKDKNFLKLIKQGFESGIYIKGIYENTTLGIPQGGIASPILFNIYMHKFDLYILTELQEFIDNINIAEDRKSKQSKNSNQLKKKRENVTNRMKTILRKIPYLNKYKNMTTQQKEKYRSLQKEYKEFTRKLRTVPSKSQNQAALFISYTRYADDWIILTNASQTLANIMKDKIQVWLENNLKLQLSVDKTKITNLYKDQALFLGFKIKNNQKKRMEKSTEKHKQNTDFLTIRINLRTAYKFTKYCCICGSSPSSGNPIEAHHVKSIRKIGQTNEGFQKIMRQLNSKQIVCCKHCHQNIHAGKYNQMKLSEFYDPILAENI